MKKLLLGFMLISTIGGTTALANEVKMPELDRSMRINQEMIEDENAPWNIPTTYAASSFSFVNQKMNVKTPLGHFVAPGTRDVNMGVVQTGEKETAKVAYQLYKTNIGSMEA